MTMTAPETTETEGHVDVPDDVSSLTKPQLREIVDAIGLDVPKSAPKDALVDAIGLYRERVRASVERSLAEEPEEIEAEAVETADEEIESTALALRDEPVVAEAALLPTTAEFDAMMAIASRIASTQMVPTAYRGKPDDVLAAILTGREMGLGPMQSLRDIYVVDGKPSLSSNLLLARMRAGGLVVVDSEATAERAWIKARRRDTGEIAEVEWTMEEAKQVKRKGKPLVDGDNWRNYPADMLWARAVGRLARRIGGDLIGAAMPYSSEEVQDWDSAEVETAADSGERPFGADRQTGQWIAPNGWSELSRRLSARLGEDAGAWMEELAEKGYAASSIAAVAQGEDRDKARDLYRRLNAVLRGLEDADLDFTVGVRQTIQRVIYEAFDGKLALLGPAWALDPEEAKTMPQRDGTPPPEAVGGDLPAEPEAATETSTEPPEAESGPEDAPETAPEAESGDDLDGIEF